MLLTFRFWLGFVVTVGFLLLFLWNVNVEEMWEALQDANYAYLLPAVLIYFVALGIRALRWRFLLSHLKSIAPWRLYPVVVIGYLANNVLPIRLGELVRANFLGDKEGVSKASALATILVERALDGLTLLLFIAVMWPFVPWTDALRDEGGGLKTTWVLMSVVVATVVVAGFLVLSLFATSPGLGRRLARVLASVSPRGLRSKVEDVTYLLVDGLGALRSPRKLLLISLLSAPVWLLEATMYHILAISFDLDVSFQVILLVTATANLATVIPTIGGIGPFEVGAKSSLIAFGVGVEPAAAYAFFVHIVALWLPVNILGLFFLWRESLSLAQVARSKRIDVSPSVRLGAKGQGYAEYGDGGAFPGEDREA